MTATRDDQQLRELRQRYPEFEIWAVAPLVGPRSWSAREAGTDQPAQKVTNDADALVAWMDEQRNQVTP